MHVEKAPELVEEKLQRFSLLALSNLNSAQPGKGSILQRKGVRVCQDENGPTFAADVFSTSVEAPTQFLLQLPNWKGDEI